MRLAFVVQRYGEEISGGAELHARLVAEHLASRHDVTVLTTCARDYVTWANEYRPGIDSIHGIPVYRFPVRRPRDPEHFGRWQQRVFHRDHTDQEARAWMDAQGPYTPRMVRWIERHHDAFDYVIAFSYRYWTTFHALRAVAGDDDRPGKGILVPTAEPDPSIELPLFRPMFHGVRAIMYNSPEERRMIHRWTGAEEVPGVVVGVGIIEPPETSAARFRAARGIDDPFLLYIGRIDRNKGCGQLFDFYRRAYRRLAADGLRPPRLLLAGTPVMEVPEHPGIVHLGWVSEQDKYDALAAAHALVMPSFYESLSMVLLEAWRLGRPVLVNAHCEVLEGQARRASGGLWYRDGAEFTECLRLLAGDARLREALGANGHVYYREHYDWSVIEDKYEHMLQHLAEHDRGVDPMAGAGPTDIAGAAP